MGPKEAMASQTTYINVFWFKLVLFGESLLFPSLHSSYEKNASNFVSRHQQTSACTRLGFRRLLKHTADQHSAISQHWRPSGNKRGLGIGNLSETSSSGNL
jgi:hypothetical protein